MLNNDIYITFSNSGPRNEVRKRVINKFMKESPGTGSQDLASKYNYYVETLSDGKHIILTRPANLKNGFDFLIRVEDTDFSNGISRRRDYPKHKDIINDLRIKKEENSEKYNQLLKLIEKVYQCNDIETAEYANIEFEVGFPVDMILGVIKWFFIEQDIRYWNYSGRAMFMSAVRNV